MIKTKVNIDLTDIEDIEELYGVIDLLKKNGAALLNDNAALEAIIKDVVGRL